MELRKISKLPILLGTLVSNPAEFCDRVKTKIDTILYRGKDRARLGPNPCDAISANEALALFQESLSGQMSDLVQDDGLREIEKKVHESTEALRLKAPFEIGYNADISLARVCYLVCRAVAPLVVLETGVAYGVTTAFLVQAMALNGRGRVHSVDLPTLSSDSENYVGYLVPRDLRHLWSFHRGSSRRVLPKLLSSLKCVDVFVQDSQHTYYGITYELETVWPFLRPGGVLIVDDVGQNHAFRDFTQRVRPSCSAVVREEHKDSMFGMIVKAA
jgi:hypothetical protein